MAKFRHDHVISVNSTFAGLFAGILGILIIWHCLRSYYIQKHPSPDVLLQITCNNTNDHHFNADTESGRLYLGVPLFSYEELKKATNNFDRLNELGNGGFASVYYGNVFTMLFQ